MEELGAMVLGLLHCGAVRIEFGACGLGLWAVGLWDCGTGAVGTVGLWDCGTAGLWGLGLLGMRPNELCNSIKIENRNGMH